MNFKGVLTLFHKPTAGLQRPPYALTRFSKRRRTLEVFYRVSLGSGALRALTQVPQVREITKANRSLKTDGTISRRTFTATTYSKDADLLLQKNSCSFPSRQPYKYLTMEATLHKQKPPKSRFHCFLTAQPFTTT